MPKALVEGLEGNLTVPFTETVEWRSNLTYMLESKNKSTGDYLSITPEFTLNSSLNWQATDDLSLLSTVTWHGRQKPKNMTIKVCRSQVRHVMKSALMPSLVSVLAIQ